ncbi:endoglucanase [Colletotrichum orchidophilum]|uniref:Endoglucanase n=1 Tax=Colletotrichum orchidophilum TaxID=1209926 RepID=A0A1G4B611_9PEZI|nr:endoglucanase [Colletotrichum orchidophilum]OHE96732.1 endoglucanase [Colletotrichum orchidophilum]
MFTNAIITFGLATLASAHMKMSSPVPYDAANLDNSPLLGDGSNFPCKASSYNAAGASNVYAQGAKGELAFIGSAVHGGGSCQVSITYDAKPNKNSVWKVIKSIEGGCPAKNTAGNLGDNANQQGKDTYDFTIPSDIPAGNGTIAWTWFNKIGNREMYMNCGPVTITGSAGSQAAYEALPNMLVANINDCKVTDSTDLKFPNPGSSVDIFASGKLTELPDNAACNALKAGGGSGGGSPAPSSAPTSTPASPQPSASKPTGNASLPGGVFITVPANGGASATPTASASAPNAPAVTPSAAPSAAPPAAPPAAPSSGTGSGNGTGTPTAGAGVQTVGAACTDEGAWNCVGGSSFQRCASGTWSAVQALAGGTSCTTGISSDLSMVVTRNGRKRALRQRSLRFRSA